MVKKKLDGAVDYSSESADQKIRKWDATVHNLGKIWRPAPSGTGSYSRLAGWLSWLAVCPSGRWNLGEAWNCKSLL